jgi:Protein of unknown function (DUF4065)
VPESCERNARLFARRRRTALTIRFKFVPAKALAAILWMVREQSALDLHTLLKACYFADKEHLNRYGRPIFGATYRAMPFGPEPLEIYEMTKGEPMWLAQLGRPFFPWRLDGYRLSLSDNIAPDGTALSDSDWEVLRAGFERSRSMTFSERTAATHGRDWQRAEFGRIDYSDMIDDGAERAARIEHLSESARFMRL